jgi:hypothetical protein
MSSPDMPSLNVKGVGRKPWDPSQDDQLRPARKLCYSYVPQVERGYGFEGPVQRASVARESTHSLISRTWSCESDLGTTIYWGHQNWFSFPIPFILYDTKCINPNKFQSKCFHHVTCVLESFAELRDLNILVELISSLVRLNTGTPPRQWPNLYV